MWARAKKRVIASRKKNTSAKINDKGFKGENAVSRNV